MNFFLLFAGSNLVSVCEDGRVSLHSDLLSGKAAKERGPEHKACARPLYKQVCSLAMQDSGYLLFTRSDGAIEVATETLDDSVSFPVRGRALSCIADNSTYQLGEPKVAVGTPEGPIHVLVLSPNHLPSTSSSSSSSSTTTSLSPPAVLNILQGHRQEVTAVAWSPTDADLLASSSFDNTAQVSEAEKLILALCRGSQGP